jgi:hypothetical protein
MDEDIRYKSDNNSKSKKILFINTINYFIYLYSYFILFYFFYLTLRYKNSIHFLIILN